MGRNIKDLTGQKFGKLKALNRTTNKGSWTMWNCICDCGEEVIREPRTIFYTRAPSCGCVTFVVHHKRRKKDGDASAHILFLNYKSNASKRNLVFELTEEFVKKVLPYIT